MNVIPLFTEEELERIVYFRSSSPGMQDGILQIIDYAADKGETEKVCKEARRMLKVMKGREL